MQRFFQSSRLHFIGSWRSHVQTVVASRMAARAVARRQRGTGGQAEGVDLSTDDAQYRIPCRFLPVNTTGSSSSSAARVGDSSEGERRSCVVHVDMDCFFAAVALLTRPELRNLPVAVAHSTG